MSINIVNAYCDLGVEIDGSRNGPKVIKENIENKLPIDKIIDCPCDCNNKSIDPNDLEKNIDRIISYTSNLYSTVLDNNKDHFIITIGGDHSIAVSSALASSKKYDDIGVIWVDAHADYNTFETTITGNIHGLPLATINGLNTKLSKFHNGKHVDPKKTVIIGYRSDEVNKQDEINNLDKNKVTYYTTEELLKDSPEKIVKQAIAIASNNFKNKVHISFDMDFIDPKDAPGVSVGEDNGPSKEIALTVLDELLKSNELIASFDLVEFNPTNDIGNKTLSIADDIINKVCKKINSI